MGFHNTISLESCHKKVFFSGSPDFNMNKMFLEGDGSSFS
jgi:hypothetical protein